jgi:hypothetical protein
MNLDKMKIFEIRGDNAIEIAKVIQNEYKQQEEEIGKLKIEVNADEAIGEWDGYRYRIIAFYFKWEHDKKIEKNGISFYRVKKYDHYIPYSRNDIERGFWEKIRNVNKMVKHTPQEFFLSGNSRYMDITKNGLLVYYPSLVEEDGKYYVILHEETKCTPIEGVIEIKKSEYYLMKENAQKE